MSRRFGSDRIVVAIAIVFARIEIQFEGYTLYSDVFDARIREPKATEQIAGSLRAVTRRVWWLASAFRGDDDGIALGLLDQNTGFAHLARIPADRDLVSAF